jgi:hypothetical protein
MGWDGLGEYRQYGIEITFCMPTNMGSDGEEGSDLLNQLESADSLNPVYLTMWNIHRAFDSVPKWLQRLAWARLGLKLQTQDLEWFLKLYSTGNINIRTTEFEAKK